MKKKVPVSILVILAVAAMAFLLQPEAEMRVLVFSKTEGYRHQSIEAGVAAIQKLGENNDFDVEATEDASAFTKQNLQRFKVVVFLNTTGDVLDEAQQNELQRFIQAGGGFVGIHSAADTEYEWPWYNELVGGWFRGHPNNPNVREGVIHVADAGHEATKMLPNPWTRSDEWYDYRDFQADEVNVLLNVDETSYKRPGENPTPEPRPISWYRAFEGGRMFYTGLGHTEESYSEPLFLEHLLGGIRYVAGDRQPVNYNDARVAPEENRFKQVVLARNLEEPMELDMLPDGRILFVERRGDVHIYDPSSGEMLTAGTLDVYTGDEDGLIGVAVDPHFSENGWIYLQYSFAGDDPHNRLSRFRLDGDVLDLASEKVMITVPVIRGTPENTSSHKAGSLVFGPDGLLYMATGDNTNPFASDGYAPLDERDGRALWDAQKSASNTNDLRGKILRIKPEADGTYSIPDGNLFPKDGSQGRPEIYTMGNRNPYRISIDAKTGWLYWGEVGPDAGEDSIGRGPMGYDEINQARAPGNYGWPYFIADNKAYYDYDFADTTSSGAPFDPAKPFNDSPNNTGARDLPPAQPAFIWYPYGPSSEFPLVGEGGRTAMAGPVYYADQYSGENRFPDYFDGKLFIYEWMRGWMMTVTMDEQGRYQRMEPFLPNLKLSSPTDMLFSPDGSLYLLEYGPYWFANSPEAQLSRIEYTSGNRAPIAQIHADRTIGAAPLTIEVSAAPSTDPDGDALSYAWTFEGEAVQSTAASASHTFEQPGTYMVRLTVTDAQGESSVTEMPILAGNEPPQISLGITGNTSYYWEGVPIAYNVTVSDAEDGSLASGIDPEQVTVTFDYLPEGADLIQPALGHQAMMEASHALLGKELIARSDCSACHHPEATSVGPAYVQIAQRYNGDAGAVHQLAEKVIRGGSGNWGDVAMAAHPQLSPEVAEKMVEYILSLDGEAPVGSRVPLKGTFQPEKHEEKQGSYVIMASYTDQGRAPIGSLTARDVVTLRGPRLWANEMDETVKGTLFVVPEGTPGLGGTEIYLGTHGAQAIYKDIELTDVGAVSATFAVPPGYATGGWVDLSLDGTPLGTFEVPLSSGGAMPMEVTLPLPPTNGRHELTFAYRNEAGDGLVAAGLWFDLKHRQQVTAH